MNYNPETRSYYFQKGPHYQLRQFCVFHIISDCPKLHKVSALIMQCPRHHVKRPWGVVGKVSGT